MKIRTKLIFISILLLIPILLMWTVTDYIITNNSEKHAFEIIKFYASTFSLTIGRQNDKANKNESSLFYNAEDLENYIKSINKIEKVDLVVLDTEKTIIADVTEKNIGTKYTYNNSNVINNTISYGTSETFKKFSPDHPKGISLYVCPIKNDKDKIVGVLLMQYDNILSGLKTNAKSTQKTLIYTGIISLLLFSLLVLYYVKVLTNWIHKTVIALRKFANGDYSVRINSNRKDELGEISNAFDQMIEQKQKNDEHIILLSNAIKSANNMIAITGANANFIFANDAFCKTYGYKEEELIGKNVELITSDKNVENYRKIYNNSGALSAGWKGERWSTSKDGRTFLVDLYLSPVKNIKGEFLGLVCVSNDITEKKLSEEALRISEEKFRLVFENIPLGIIYVDPSGKLIDCNDVFLEILDITRKEFRKFDMAQIEDERFLEAFKLARSGIIGKYQGDYTSVISKKVVSLKVSFAPIVNKDQILGIVGMFEDISEMKQIERFFFHDIMNTAGNLHGYIELLKEEDLGNEINNQLINRVYLVENQLIEELISHRSILLSDRTMMKLKLTKLNTLDFLIYISNNFEKMLKENENSIIIDNDAENLEIETDIALLSRVLENLIKNAVEASDAEQEISVGVKSKQDSVSFWTHNKAYIPENIQNKIFVRSFSTKGGGRGIGTYSIKYLTETYLQGEVYFTSDEKEGTYFYVEIPVKLKEIEEA